MDLERIVRPSRKPDSGEDRYDPDCHHGTLEQIEERERREQAEMFKGLYEENPEAFWKLVKFEAEHEPDRLNYYEELEEVERQKRREERLRRAKEAPPLPSSSLSLTEALERLEGVRLVGDRRWLAKCPAHEDRSPSLTVKENEARPGEAIVHCHAGCDWKAVKDALR